MFCGLYELKRVERSGNEEAPEWTRWRLKHKLRQRRHTSKGGQSKDSLLTLCSGSRGEPSEECTRGGRRAAEGVKRVGYSCRRLVLEKEKWPTGYFYLFF